MQKISLLWLLSLPAMFNPVIPQTTTSTEEVVLEGYLTGLTEPLELSFVYEHLGASKSEKVSVSEDGRFSFSAVISEPVIAKVKHHSIGIIKFVLAPGSRLVMTGDVRDTTKGITIKGDRHNEAYNRYRIRSQPLEVAEMAASRKLLAALKAPAEEREAISNDFLKILTDLRAWQKEFIKHNPDAFVSVYLLSELITSSGFDYLNQSFNSFSEEFKTTYYGKLIAGRIKELHATAPGKAAPDFTFHDMNGDTLRLSDYKGKYVLLDFWGSWCAPCRKSHPHLKELYKTYKDQGLVIIGVSNEKKTTSSDLNAARSAWRKAIEEDGIGIWPQVLYNENKEKMDIIKAFAVTAYPTKILIDKNGKIVSRFITTINDLDPKLKEIFGK